MQASAHCQTPHGLGKSLNALGLGTSFDKENVAVTARLENPFLLVVHLGEVGGLGQGEGEEKKEVRGELSCVSESVPCETKGGGREMSNFM